MSSSLNPNPYQQRDIAENDDSGPYQSEYKDHFVRMIESMTQQAHNSAMTSDITRAEFASEIKAIEARTDSKVAEIRGDIKALSAEMRGELHAYIAESRERDKRIELLSDRAVKAAESASTLKVNLWAAIVAVIIAIASSYYATQSSNIGILQLMTAAFQQGQADQPSPLPPEKPKNK